MATTDISKVLKRRENASVFKQEDKKDVNTQDLINRRNTAKADLDLWRDLLESAYHYAVPNYNPWVNHGRGGALTPGQVLNAEVYDLTLPIAHNRLVNKMLTGMIPKGQQWLQFEPGSAFGEPGTTVYKNALAASQAITDAWFDILDRSNFYLAAAESMSDAVISTGVLAVNEGTKKNPLRFEAVPVSHVMFEGNALGGFTAVFRDWMDVRVDYIQQVWPDAKRPHNKEAKAKVNIYECSYIDYEAEEDVMFKYVVMTSSREVLWESEGPSWPWTIFRMRKLTGENRGRGPSLDAMPTAATINEAFGDELIAAAFTANPMFMASSDSAFNEDTFEAKPGVIIPVQMVQGEYPIQMFPSGGNINFSALLISDLRQQINELLFTAPLGPISSPETTATEANIRNMENLESFLAMVPRLQSEFFDSVVKRSMFLINKVAPETFGNIPEDIRKRMISVDGEILGLKYQTPLMTARGQVKVQKLMNYFSSVANVMGPEIAAATLNATDVPQMVAENTGVDVDLLKDKEQMQAELDQAAQITQEVAEETLNDTADEV